MRRLLEGGILSRKYSILCSDSFFLYVHLSVCLSVSSTGLCFVILVNIIFHVLVSIVGVDSFTLHSFVCIVSSWFGFFNLCHRIT